MKGAVVDRSKRRVLTYEDYLRLTDDKRCELINGRLEEMPAPGFEHQDLLTVLLLKFRSFTDQRDLGKVLPAPFDIILSETVVVQPDIVFISKDNLKNIKNGRLFGPPDLAVEIISPGSFYRDRYEKFSLYEKYGVKEYWIVYPGERVVEAWVLNDKGEYELFSVAEGEGKVKSKVLDGLEVELREVFIPRP